MLDMHRKKEGRETESAH